MHDSSETVISTVSCTHDRRIVIVLRPADRLPIVLRTESFSADVGWFAQQSISLSRSELQCLRNLLGVQVHRACEVALSAIEGMDRENTERENMNRENVDIIPFESARQLTA